MDIVRAAIVEYLVKLGINRAPPRSAITHTRPLRIPHVRLLAEQQRVGGFVSPTCTVIGQCVREMADLIKACEPNFLVIDVTPFYESTGRPSVGYNMASEIRGMVPGYEIKGE